MATTYLDSSAIVKLVLPEEASKALRTFLGSRVDASTSDLAVTEVIRAARRSDPAALETAERVLRRFRLVALTPAVLRLAAAVPPATLRSLDAIHLASAMLLQPELDAIVTYDARMQEGVRALGLPLAVPG